MANGNSDVLTSVQTLSAVGYGKPVIFQTYQVGLNPSSIWTILSSGASLTYSVLVGVDDPNVAGWSASTAQTLPLSNFNGLTASGLGSLAAVVNYILPWISAYTSGTLIFGIAQYNRT